MKKCTVTLQPAPENHGYEFQRIDLDSQPIIETYIDNVISVVRGTTLGKHGASITLVEHVLVALSAMRIDNRLIQVGGPEVPVLDGSALPFCEVIEMVGQQEVEKKRDPLELKLFMLILLLGLER